MEKQSILLLDESCKSSKVLNNTLLRETHCLKGLTLPNLAEGGFTLMKVG